MSRIRHNPKANMPAVYIPCWLLQVPIQKISHGAKIFYGRLAQWSTSGGDVLRSIPQLSQEMGISRSSVDRLIKELKDIGLIDTFQPQAGGISHFQFFDHEWMNEPIKSELSYNYDPTSDLTLPHVNPDVTPTSDLTYININKIKRNKTTTKTIISVPDETPIADNDSIVNAYHEILPDCPKVKVIDRKLKCQLDDMRKKWPNYQKDSKPFSIESFKDYLNYIKKYYSWFVQPYKTEAGNMKRNNLRVFTREINICKIVNGEFSAS